MRDPYRHEPIDKNSFIFYFGKISLNLLTFDIQNGEYTLKSVMRTSFTDIGVRSKTGKADFKNYNFGKTLTMMIMFTLLSSLLIPRKSNKMRQFN